MLIENSFERIAKSPVPKQKHIEQTVFSIETSDFSEREMQIDNSKLKSELLFVISTMESQLERVKQKRK